MDRECERTDRGSDVMSPNPRSNRNLLNSTRSCALRLEHFGVGRNEHWGSGAETECDSYSQTASVPLVSDNQGGIFLVINSAHDRRLKHVDICYHFIREYVDANHVSIVYISIDNMIADILTKPLKRIKFELFCKKLGISND